MTVQQPTRRPRDRRLEPAARRQGRGGDRRRRRHRRRDLAPVRRARRARSRSPRSIRSGPSRAGRDIEAAGGTCARPRGRRHRTTTTSTRLADAVLEHARARRRAGEQRRRLPAARALPRSRRPSRGGRCTTINLLHVFAVTHAFLDSMIERRARLDRERALGRGDARLPGRTGLRRDEGGGRAVHDQPGGRSGRHGIRVNGIGPDLTQTPQVDYLTGYEGARRPVGVVGAGRPPRLARGPGPGRAVPGVRPVVLRDRPQHPRRRRHEGRRRLVLVADRAPVRQPADDALSRARARSAIGLARPAEEPRARPASPGLGTLGSGPFVLGRRNRASEGISHRREVFGVAERVGSGHGESVRRKAQPRRAPRIQPVQARLRPTT